MPLEKLTKQHKTDIVKLLADYWAKRGMPQYDEKWAEEYLAEGHKKEVKQDDFFIYVEDEKLIGVISLITDVSDVAEIRDEVVFPEYQNEGYLEKMLLELIEIAKSRNVRKIYVLALQQNAGTYQSLGFGREGELKSHFVDGEDLVIFSKFL